MILSLQANIITCEILHCRKSYGKEHPKQPHAQTKELRACLDAAEIRAQTVHRLTEIGKTELKGKVDSEQAMIRYGWSEGKNPLIFLPRNFMEISGHFHALTSLLQSLHSLLCKNLDVFQSPAGSFGEEINPTSTI